MRLCVVIGSFVVFSTVGVSPAAAQMFEHVGTRAQGMGGAFVAVADDATAAWWNPAGLASGAYVNVVFEKGLRTEPGGPGPLGPAVRTGSRGFAAAFPALGISYYPLRISSTAPVGPTGANGAIRQLDPGGVAGRVRSLSLAQWGVTVGQSIGDHLVIGSTLKFMRGGVASVATDGSSDGLDRGDDLEVERRTRMDLDIGALARMGPVRLGAALRNVTKPRFGDDADPVALVRQARVGAAVVTSALGLANALTVSADVDVTSTPSLFGDVRHAAAGGELWLANRRLGVRAGVTANTLGERRLASSSGVSVGLTRGFFFEASRTRGADDSLVGWSTSVRLTF